MKPLNETNLGVAQPFFLTPKKDHFKTQTNIFYIYFLACNPIKETFTAKYDGVLPRTP